MFLICSQKVIARRSVSRVLSHPWDKPLGGDGHSSGTFVAERLARPTRAAARKARPAAPAKANAACRSYLVLLPVGFSLPPPSPAARCALTAPFHPCRPPGVPGQTGGVLFVALSLGAPPPGVSRHRTSLEPGLSSPRPKAESGHPAVWLYRFGYRSRGCRGSCAWVPGSQLRRAPERRRSLRDRLVQVAPFRILLFDEPDLPIAPPFLELFFAPDRGGGIVIDLEPDQTIDAVSPGEARDDFGLVLMDTADEIPGHAEIERPVSSAGEEIDVEGGHSGTAL